MKNLDASTTCSSVAVLFFARRKRSDGDVITILLKHPEKNHIIQVLARLRGY